MQWAPRRSRRATSGRRSNCSARSWTRIRARIRPGTRSSVVALRAGLPDVAAEHAKRALDLDRRNPVYLNNLGVAYGELGVVRRGRGGVPARAEGEAGVRRRPLQPGQGAAQARPARRGAARVRARVRDRRGVRRCCARACARCTASTAGRARDGGAARGARRPRAERRVRAGGGGDAAGGRRRRERRRLAAAADRAPGRTGTRRATRSRKMLLSLGEWREGWREYLWRPHLLDERSERAPAPLLPRLAGTKRAGARRAGARRRAVLPALRGRAARARRRGQPRRAAQARRRARGAGGCEVLAEEDAPAARFDRAIWGGDLPALLESAGPVAPALPLARDDARAARCRRRLAELGPAPYLARDLARRHRRR